MKKPSPRPSGFTLIELLVVVAVIAILAGILFPVFAAARDKARQAACLSQLRQIGSALALYLQDYDERMPNCCSWGRWYTWRYPDLWRDCAQTGITRSTPKNSVIGPVQSPPRYIQEFLHPYVQNEQLWFCPSVSRERVLRGDPKDVPTVGFNGTSYNWNWVANPSGSTRPNPFQQRPPITVSGLPVAEIPRPSEAPVLWDLPHWNPTRAPCTEFDLRPAHAKGVNVLFADAHAKFSPFAQHLSPNAMLGDCLENWATEHQWEGYYE